MSPESTVLPFGALVAAGGPSFHPPPRVIHGCVELLVLAASKVGGHHVSLGQMLLRSQPEVTPTSGAAATHHAAGHT
ncbi:hypothetical protein CJ030_MR7G017773 [Morella rubra]|uniref:Uncharacterized protein n=1 Tax=Morella rubra TaxID=262757 RepID=A0A6A1UYS8_9ROSI|nr:hypothetical protein CJ030_MR7G017766 [Morella rubra]KAB1205601.1 hypothetical protein CJ030_MR7G017773 [Morella rubra]